MATPRNNALHRYVLVVLGLLLGTFEFSAVHAAATKPQVISFVGSVPKLYVGRTVGISTKSSSQLAVTVSSLTTNICTVANGVVQGVSSGVCKLAANQAGDLIWKPGKQVIKTLTVLKNSNSITFSLPSSVLSVGGTVTASLTASSGLSARLSSLTTAVCTVSGTQISAVAAGQCRLAGDQSGDATYLSATRVTKSITVSKATQSISFGESPVVTVGKTATLAVTASSGLKVILKTNTPKVCSVSGAIVTGIKLGTCSIQATQAGDSAHYGATSKTLSFSVGAAAAAPVVGIAITKQVGVVDPQK